MEDIQKHFLTKYNGVISAIILQDLYNLFSKIYCINKIKFFLSEIYNNPKILVLFLEF